MIIAPRLLPHDGHQVIPNVKTTNAMRSWVRGTLWFEYTSLGKQASHLKNRDSFLICMGETNNPDFKKLAQRIFQKYTSPILQVSVNPESTGIHTQVIRVSLSQLSHDQYDFCLNTLEQYAQKSWRSKNEQKKYRWEMAILVDPNEKNATQ
ncbi:RimK-like ATPgrasp N-terminal domain-containing protein [Vibrio sp. PP-XX7]